MKRAFCSVAFALLTAAPMLSEAAPRPSQRETITSTTAEARENFRPIRSPLAVVEQLSGLHFDWKREYGGYSDMDCFPVGDLTTSAPELLDWEVPGEVVRGIRRDRLFPYLIEATKEVEVHVEDCYRLLLSLAEQFSALDERVSRHGTELSRHETSITTLHTQLCTHEATIARLQCRTKELEAKNLQLETQIQELRAAVQQLQNAAGGGAAPE